MPKLTGVPKDQAKPTTIDSRFKMIPASQLRQIQTETDAARRERAEQAAADFLPRFQTACENYKKKVLSTVEAALNHIREKRLTYKYIMLDFKTLIENTDGFAYTTMLYGFWNKDSQSFDDTIYTKNELKKPLDAAIEELATLGYTLENVSDSSRSKRLYLKLSW